jgi:hypothetical protein
MLLLSGRCRRDRQTSTPTRSGETWMTEPPSRTSPLTDRHKALGSGLEDWNGMGTVPEGPGLGVTCPSSGLLRQMAA